MILPRRALLAPFLTARLAELAAFAAAFATAVLLWVAPPAARSLETGFSLVVPADGADPQDALRILFGGTASVQRVPLSEVQALADRLELKVAGEPLPALFDGAVRLAADVDRGELETALTDRLPGALLLWRDDNARSTGLEPPKAVVSMLAAGALAAAGLWNGAGWIRRNRRVIRLARLHGAGRTDLRRAFRRRRIVPFAFSVVLGGGLAAVVVGLVLQAADLPPSQWFDRQPEAVVAGSTGFFIAACLALWLMQELGALAALRALLRRDGIGPLRSGVEP